MICQLSARFISSISIFSHLQLVPSVVRHSTVSFRATCISARKCQRKFRHKFRCERVPSKETIHNLVNTLRITGLSINKKQNHKCRMLTEEK
jgi:hypothetical protein